MPQSPHGRDDAAGVPIATLCRDAPGASPMARWPGTRSPRCCSASRGRVLTAAVAVAAGLLQPHHGRGRPASQLRAGHHQGPRRLHVVRDGAWSVRYDGAHLIVYRHDPTDPASLPFGSPACLLEDRERRLWVGTASSERAGLGVLDRSTGRFTRYLADGRPGSLSAPYVQAIYQDREGRLGGARAGHRPLRPAVAELHGLPDRPRRQRAAGDGDAGGLARHLLGGHGEEAGCSSSTGPRAGSAASPFGTGPRRARRAPATRSSPPSSSSRPGRCGWPATARASSASTSPAGERSATCPMRGARIR